MVKKVRNISKTISYLGAIIIILPLIFLLLNLNEQSPSFSLIVEHVLFSVITNTLLLMFLTIVTTTIIGVYFAILTSLYDFPFKKLVHVLLILPMAIPPYIAAFNYAHLLSFMGPVQTFLRTFNFNMANFSIMNIFGAVFIFTITLYPYVYLICRVYLKNHSRSIVESAAILGGARKFFVIIKLLTPSIISGTTLVALEVMNDIGVSHYFGIRTLSNLIFQAHNQMFDVSLASRISLTAIVIAFVYIFTSRILINDKKYVAQSRSRPIKPIKLKRFVFPLIPVFIVISIAFLVPVVYMVYMVDISNLNVAHLFTLTLNTIKIALLTSLIIIFFALIIVNYARFCSKKEKSFLKITNLGYAIPSTILAIGTISLFSFIANFGFSFGFSITMLVFAYVIKYFSLGYLLIERAFEKNGKIYTESSKMSGRGDFMTFIKVDIFTIKNGLIGAFLLIFIDIVKELPLTLILRSFNFETLSTRIYMFAANEQIPNSAPFSLVIVFICTIFIVLLGDKNG